MAPHHAAPPRPGTSVRVASSLGAVLTGVRRVPRSIWLLAAHAFAALCAVQALTECSFMVPSGSGSTSQIQRDAAVGLFARSVYDSGTGDKLGCVRYTSHADFDALLRAGRAFGVVTALLVLGSLLGVAAVRGWRPRRASAALWAGAQYALMAATVAQMFAFCAVGSDHLCPGRDCRLTGVGILSAINVIVLAVISILYFLEDCPEAPWFVWWEEQDRPDGRKAAARTLPMGSGRAQRSPTAGAGRSLEELDPDDPYQMTPSFSFTSGESRPSGGASSSSLGSLGWHGLRRFRLTLLGLFLVSWTLSLVGVRRCTLLLVGPAGGGRDHFSGVGLFSRAVYYRGDVIGCIDYPAATRAEFDAPFQAGRIFGTVTALLMTFLGLLVAAQVVCDTARHEVWLVVRMLLPCATLSQLLTLLVYGTETCSANDLIDCAPGQLGVWVILNVLLMTGLSVLVNCVPPPPGPLLRLRTAARDATKDPPGSWAGAGAAVAPHPVFRNMAAPGSEPKGRRVAPPPPPSPRHGTPPRRQQDAYDDDGTAIDSYYLGCASPTTASSEPTVGLQPWPGDEASAELITVSVEFVGTERRTVRTVTHRDGSKTITTTTEEMDFDEDDAVDTDDEDADAADTSTEYDGEADDSRCDPGSCSVSAAEGYSEEENDAPPAADDVVSGVENSSESEHLNENDYAPGSVDEAGFVSASSSAPEELESASGESPEEACLRVNDSFDLD